MGEKFSPNLQRLLGLRQRIMRELIDGKSYAQAAYEYKTAKYSLMSVMGEYRPYRTWINTRKQNRLLMEDEFRQYLLSGKPVAFLSELYDMTYDETRKFVHSLELRDGESYLGIADSSAGKRFITVADVARFKVDVQVGEMLVCDETEDGVQLYGRVLKKHLWYADTEFGAIDWNWLCVKNIRRLDGDEIIHG